MNISKGYIKEMVRYAEVMDASSFSVPISEYKGWVVRVSVVSTGLFLMLIRNSRFI